MKKYLLLFLFSMVAAISFAQKEAECYVDGSLRAKLGETVSLSLQLRNNFNVVGMQFKLVLPEGVSFKTIKNSTRVTDGMTIGKVNLPAGNGVSFTVETDGNVWFGGTDGEIFNITLQVDANAELGQKSISFKDISCAFNENDIIDEITQRNFEVSLTIYDTYNISATSADEAMGSVAITPNGEVENGTSVTATATANDGYSFVNWTNAEGTEVSTENPYTFELVAPVALTANFQAIKYPVVFKNGEEVVQEGNLDYASVITAPKNPTKEGYTFLGWFAGETQFVEGATVPVGGITYEAKWQINQYTITFDTDGGSEIAPITQDYNTAVTTPAAPTKTGYTFVAWDKEIPATMPAENITIKATWQINQYTITFDSNGGTEVAPITQDYASEITAPENPTRVGYEFAGWDKEIPATMPAENITIKATWQINQYTITFDSNGGTEVAPITQNYASGITAPTAPTRVGYEFAGWDKEIPATMPAEDMTITAQWTAKKFIYTFNKKDDKDNVASDVIEIEQTFDTDVVMPTDEQLEWEGHTFEKYVETVPEKVTEDGEKTFTAQYSINTYKVTYYLNDEVVNVAEVKYGEAIPAYEPTVEEGMKFDGWQEEIPAVMPAYDLEIHGTTSGIETAIKNIVAKFGESFDVYNVSGRLVQRVNGASDISRIPAGMYIINGTKVVIRKD